MLFAVVMRLPTVRSGGAFHQHMGWTLGGVEVEFFFGWMLVRKCWTCVWISLPGPLPCESEAQCLPSETWLRFRPDGLVQHLREPHRPRARLSPSPPLSSLSSLPLPLFPLHLIFHSNPISSSSFFFFFYPLFPFISRRLPLWASQFPPSLYLHPLPDVPHPPLCSALLFLTPSLPSFLSRLSSSFILCRKVSKMQKKGGCVEKPDHCGRGDTGSTSLPDLSSSCLQRH